MIDLYYWTTPNGHKITMFLEETGLPYRIVPIHIGKGEQFAPDFLHIAPNNRIPAIVDHQPQDGAGPLALFESGAILLYLADKSKQLIPSDLRGRSDALQWLFWQVAGLGPMAGQNNHFSHAAPEKIPYAIERYVKETSRLYAVLDKRLADREFLAGKLLHRRHRKLSVDRRVGASVARPPAVSSSQALVRGHPWAPRHRACLREGKGREPGGRATAERRGGPPRALWTRRHHRPSLTRDRRTSVALRATRHRPRLTLRAERVRSRPRRSSGPASRAAL